MAQEAAAVFGLPIAKWYDLQKPENIKTPLQDVSLALLYSLYSRYPTTAPKSPPSIPDFYEFLGFKDTREDKTEFARLIGRRSPSAYRLLAEGGQPSRPLIRYIEALQQMGLNGRQTRKVMEEVASYAYSKSSGGA